MMSLSTTSDVLIFATRSIAESLSLASTSVWAAGGKGGSGGSEGNVLALVIGARSGNCGAEAEAAAAAEVEVEAAAAVAEAEAASSIDCAQK